MEKRKGKHFPDEVTITRRALPIFLCRDSCPDCRGAMAFPVASGTRSSLTDQDDRTETVAERQAKYMPKK
jgi:hypothetical protein